MSDYTPTWFEIRERVEHDTWLTADEADRWLAEHDAQVRAETLRNFADSIPGDIHDPRHVADLARGVADHIEKSESEAREVFEDWLAEQADRGCGHPNHGAEAHDCAPFLPDREPSDGEVEAAAEVFWEYDMVDDYRRERARAALIAAQEVRRG